MIADISNWHTYLTPYDSSVKYFYRQNAKGQDMTLAKSLYNAVRTKIEYRDDLTLDDWSLPKLTLERGFGDCEDQSALLTSLYILAGFQTKMIMFYPLGWEIAHVATLIKDYPRKGWNRVDPTRDWDFEEKTSYAPITVDLYEISLNGTIPLIESFFTPFVNIHSALVRNNILPNSRPLIKFPVIKDLRK